MEVWVVSHMRGGVHVDSQVFDSLKKAEAYFREHIVSNFQFTLDDIEDFLDDGYMEDDDYMISINSYIVQ